MKKQVVIIVVMLFIVFTLVGCQKEEGNTLKNNTIATATNTQKEEGKKGEEQKEDTGVLTKPLLIEILGKSKVSIKYKTRHGCRNGDGRSNC